MNQNMIAVDITVVCPDCKDIPEEKIRALIQQHKQLIKKAIVNLCHQQ